MNLLKKRRQQNEPRQSWKTRLVLLAIAGMTILLGSGEARESQVIKFYNYPNPLLQQQTSTTIVIQVKKVATMKLEIYDLAGDLVWKKVIQNGQSSDQQELRCEWNGTATSGAWVAPGVYLCVLRAIVSDKTTEVFETRTIKIGVRR